MRFLYGSLKLLFIAAVISSIGYLLIAPRIHYHAMREERDAAEADRKSSGIYAEAALDLTAEQAESVKVSPLGSRDFRQECHAFGNIDFNEDLSVEVFPPYQGRIIDAKINVGDRVSKGQILYTIDSPDLLSAESTLIAAAGVSVLQAHTLNRMKTLIKAGGVSQQNFDQTTSDQMAAEGALKAARDTVRIFGKTDAEINNIIETRRADPMLIVRSPIDGYVTARSAQPGLFVQPGTAPAPLTVANMSIMWMMADVVEDDAPELHVGDEVFAKVNAYSGRVFRGRISVVSPMIDPNTRRVATRSDIEDPGHLLRSGMLTNFRIEISHPIRSVAAPTSAVVREGNGSMTVWTTSDDRHFIRRFVHIGIDQDGFFQILDGVTAGDRAVVENASFLSNMFNSGGEKGQ